jgi:hypothetical protein
VPLLSRLPGREERKCMFVFVFVFVVVVFVVGGGGAQRSLCEAHRGVPPGCAVSAAAAEALQGGHQGCSSHRCLH